MKNSISIINWPFRIGLAHLREFKKYGIKSIGILRKNFIKNKEHSDLFFEKKSNVELSGN